MEAPKDGNNQQEQEIKDKVKEGYTDIAKNKYSCQGCCASKQQSKIASEIGYSEDDIKEFGSANLGLGCGNPTQFIEIKEGFTVVDLGSGPGFDSFLAAKKVGKKGKVIGIDMTEEMIKLANENAVKYGYADICEFKLGDIENIPLQDNTVDLIFSNCVINLAPSKEKVFKEAHRILKKGGKVCISDIVLLEELTQEQRSNKQLLVGCVAGAWLKDRYLQLIEKVGFKIVTTKSNKDISKKQYQGINLESLTYVAEKV